MNPNEFREEFKILYDNISSNAAPGLDDYEMSVYLTTAQLELVKRAYSGGVGKQGFEGNERRRRELSQLVRMGEYDVTPLTTSRLSSASVQAELPVGIVMYILHERVKITSSNACINNTWIEVTPIKLDEFELIDENPFRKASKRKALRLDLFDSNKFIVELICPETIVKYSLRYLAVPNPIILSDLTAIGPGLSINGVTALTGCTLNESMHKEILKRAVDLAIRDYRENTLSNKIQSQNGFDYKED